MTTYKTTKSTKKNITTSINQKLLEHLDSLIDKRGLNRSDAVEQAIRLWIEKEIESDDNSYFAESKEELNKDAQPWNRTTTESSKQS